MIKASELRVGNYVLIDTNDDRSGIRAITAISKYASGEGSISYNVGDYTTVGFFIRDVKPIPLTPEWLERFGFEVAFTADNVNYYRIKTDRLFGNFVVREKSGKFFIDISGAEIQVKLVHTLQNAFALTGQELELKEKS